MSPKARQELLNTYLSLLLSSLGLECAAERRISGKTPDLRLRHPRLGIVFGEAEVGESFSDSSAREKLVRRARERFSDNAFYGIDSLLLIVYPRELVENVSTQPDHVALSIIKQADLGVGLAGRPTETLPTLSAAEPRVEWWGAPVKPAQIPQVLDELSGRVLGARLRPEDLADTLSRIISERAEHSLRLDAGWRDLWKRIASAFEIDCTVLRNERDCAILALKTLLTHCAACFIIYELARSRFPSTLRQIDTVTVRKAESALADLLKVNYAEEVEYVLDALRLLPDDTSLNQLLSSLYEIITTNVATLRHSGWEVLAYIYQRLLSETYRKAYATFYTKLPAAYLLAKLAIDSPDNAVVDPAMGSGSLLLSSYYVMQWLALSSPEVYQISEESVLDSVAKRVLSRIIGLDALRGAVALTGAVLTIASSAVPRDKLKLFHVPVGADSSGSLEFLIPTSTLFQEARKALRKQAIDVVIMNPPFTRSDRIPNLIGEKARKKLLAVPLTFGGVELEKIFAAGLAKPFLALADSLLKPGGRIAAVLPNSVLSRPSWEDVRRGISKSYDLEWLVVSWAPRTPNFSSDTEFREILVVLRKRSSVDRAERSLRVVNLLKGIDELHPSQVAALAAQLKKVSRGYLVLNGEPVAEVDSLPQGVLERDTSNWYRFIAFRNTEILDLHVQVLQHCKPLGNFFEVGSVVDHKGGYIVTSRVPCGEKGYKAVWGTGKNSGILRPLADKPKHEVIVTDEDAAKVKFWKNLDKYQSTIFILRRGRLYTQHVLMYELEENAISNEWWPLKLRSEVPPEFLLSMLAYMNSTFGLIHMLGERLETEGVWVEYKKEQLEKLPIPDFTACSCIEPLRKLGVYDALQTPLDLNIGDYIEKMSLLELEHKGFTEALRQALRDPNLRARARLDEIALQLLQCLGINVEQVIGERLYQHVKEEIESLRRIMERGRKEDDKIVEEIERNDKKRHKAVGVQPLDKFFTLS